MSTDLPREGPRITGNEQENRKGDSMFLNCTSARSYPAAILSWDIDGEKVISTKIVFRFFTPCNDLNIFLSRTILLYICLRGFGYLEVTFVKLFLGYP